MKSKKKKLAGLSGFKTALPFLLPSLIGFIIFRFVPIIVSAAISFTNWDGVHELSLFSKPISFMQEWGVGLDNYSQILTTSEFWRVLWHNIYFILLYLPLVLVMSLAVAMVLNRKCKGIGIYRVLYYIPVLTSWVAGSLIWKWVLSPEYGMINEILGVFGITGPGWLQSEVWAMPAVVMASVWKDMGYFGLIFLGGLQGIDPTYYEASNIDGASKWKQLRKITLPLLSPTTFLVIITAIINSFQLFTQIMIMTANSSGVVGGPNGATQVMVERIYTYAFDYQQMGYASAYSWVLFVIILIFTVIQMKGQKRWVHYDA